MLPSEPDNLSVDSRRRLGGITKTISSEVNVMSLQSIKSKQIAQIRLLPYRIVELKRDLEYKIILSDSPEFSIYISLPPFFPQEKPQFRLSEPLLHPWVTDIFVDKCPHLNNFSVHANLSQIVKEIVEEMHQVHSRGQMDLQSTAPSRPGVQIPNYATRTAYFHPNAALQSSFPNLSAPSNNSWSSNFSSRQAPACMPAAAMTSTFNGSVAQNSSALPASSASPPHENENFEITSVQDLDKLSTEEILLTLNDPERLERLIVSCHGKQIEAYWLKRKEFAKHLEEMARSNLAMSTVLEDKKSLLAQKSAQHRELASRVDALTKQFEEKSKSVPDSEVLFDSLRVVTMEAEEKSEAIAKSFTEGKMSAEEFSKAFQEQRKLFHTRSIKCHKFREHLCYGIPL